MTYTGTTAVLPMDVPKLFEALTAQPTTRGFKPINGPKRSLTPTSSVAISSPFKRLAVETVPKLPVTPEHGTGCRALPNHLSTFEAEVEFEPAEQCLLSDIVRTSPSTSEAATEIPETPPSTLPLPRTHVAGSWHEEADSWMNEFVNLDTVADECFVPFKDAPAGHYKGTTRPFFNADAVATIAKPLPDLDVENYFVHVVQDEEATMEDSKSDHYSLEDSDEEEMAMLLTAADGNPAKLSPSSSAQDIDQDSRSTGSFDSKLHSSSSDVSHHETSKTNLPEPDLLDEDIDWDIVLACAKNAVSNPKTKALVEGPRMHESSVPSSPAPIIRPPFPPKMRDRSVVVGLSSATMMRTCFRIGELLNAHAKCTRDKQDVVLELFARVRHSNRETLARVQHFQLRDIFTDKQPFLSGAFRGWKLNGRVDHYSRSLLGPSGEDKLCRCVCQLSDAKETSIGRTATILSIRETTWDEVFWALRIAARDAPSDSG